MKLHDIDSAIYERYIAPTEREPTKKVGLEFELPIVNRRCMPVDFRAVHRMTDEFISRFSFATIQRDDDGSIYSAVNDATGDGLSYDCSFNTLEFSFGTEEDMNRLYSRFRDYYTFAVKSLGKENHTLTGMGINPRHGVNHNVPVRSERYRMLLHHLSSYTLYGDAIPFHSHPNFGLFSCASQVQLDVRKDTLARTVNTFNKLEPMKALLLANSPWGEGFETLCSRDNFWKNSLHGLNRRNVDMFDRELTGVDDIIDYIRGMSIYCVERDGKYINFRPTPLTEYFTADSVEGEFFDGSTYRDIRFAPRAEDIQYLRAFKLEDITFRGTVEFRSVCQQPVSEIMATGALHAGLIQELDALTELLDSDRTVYNRGYTPMELRAMFNMRELPDFLDKRAASALLLRIVELAESGLRRRGFGEEKYLAPLYGRAERLLSPARQMADGIDRGKTLDDYIEEYGRLANV